MAWLDPATAPPPAVGEFLIKARSRNGVERKMVLRRTETTGGKVIGVAGGVFEFDLGQIVGWHPLPEGLE